MITPEKRVFTSDKADELLGGYVKSSMYNGIVGTVEKAPPYLSKYIVEFSSELKIFKREKGIQIQLRNLLENDINFIIYDHQINKVVWHENQSPLNTPKFRYIIVLLSIILMFFLDAVINRNKLLYLPLFFGLLLGMLGSLFYPNSRKEMVTLVSSVNEEHEVIILSEIRYSKFRDFFEEYYPEKSSRI